MRARVNPARLGALWFGIQAVWSAVLGVTLQARAQELDPAHGVALYARVAVAGALVATLVQLLAGAASDRALPRRGHRRAFYAGGVLLALPALVLLTAAGTPALLVAAFVALQLGMNVANGPYQAGVPDHVPPEREGEASAWMGALASAGAIAGLLAATLLRGVPLGVALAALLALGAAITLAHARRLGAVAAARDAGLVGRRRVATLLVSRALVFLGFYTLFGFLFFFVRETLGAGDPRTTTGVVFLVFTAAAIGGAALAARPTDRGDRRAVVAGAGALIVAGVAAFAAAPSIPVALAAAAVCGAAWGAFSTADWAIAFDVLPRRAMATAMGVWNAAVTLPQVAAPLVTAPLVAALDARRAGLGPRAAFLLVALEFALGAAVLCTLGPLRAPARS